MFEGSIIIIEKDASLREMLYEHFSEKGYSVQAKEDSQTALNYLEASKFDVMIADLTTTCADGKELLYHMRSQYPLTRLIMTSGFLSLDKLLNCAQNQIETVIFKPINDFSEIDLAVKKSIEQHNVWRRKFTEYEQNFKNGTP
ncbi:MAG: response regulator [Lentisphaeraceae bacterium]|nr:response regulator [Lentisphaeraceae bacterium]